jgi:hypothetical protein
MFVSDPVCNHHPKRAFPSPNGPTAACLPATTTLEAGGADFPRPRRSLLGPMEVDRPMGYRRLEGDFGLVLGLEW